MGKKIAVLGSTGSIGTQTLDVLRYFKNDFEVIGLAAGENIGLLSKQIQEFKPKIVSVKNEKKAQELRQILAKQVSKEQVSAKIEPEICFGPDGLRDIATYDEVEIVVVSVSGTEVLIPTLEAIKKQKIICLATKEILVTAGKIIMQEAQKHGTKILPVDSEHSAIFQCIQNHPNKEIFKIILTASGGPFFGCSADELKKVTPNQALKHPNWSMGKKITIDSATMMNKGLEVIEAHWLFNIDYNRIDVLIHPQSIIHSMVEFLDGSIIAQLGITDMKIPIQYALSYPERWENDFDRLNLSKIGKLTFFEPDTKNFPCLTLAYEAGKTGGSMPAVLNGANDAVVIEFLNNNIKFIEIPIIIEKVMNKHNFIKNPSLEDIIYSSNWAFEEVIKIIRGR